VSCEVHGIEHTRRSCPLCELEATVATQKQFIDSLREAQEDTLEAMQQLVRLHADPAKKLLETNRRLSLDFAVLEIPTRRKPSTRRKP
jgi:hypothetical protein